SFVTLYPLPQSNPRPGPPRGRAPPPAGGGRAGAPPPTPRPAADRRPAVYSASLGCHPHLDR
uniref:hypothetical protein n=1 Tax=Nocardia wallacei TaxID=480035 RepID=UPI0024584A1D